jgi:hypothetical protein
MVALPRIPRSRVVWGGLLFPLLVLARPLGCSSYGETGSDGGAPPSAVDGGNPSAATPDGSATGGPLPSAPGQVECGDSSCDLATSFCCVLDPADLKCVANEGACDGNRGRCDESADCTNGQMCCSTFSAGKFATVCDTSCMLTQSCRTDAECGGKKCVKQRCTGFVTHLCGPIPFCEVL